MKFLKLKAVTIFFLLTALTACKKTDNLSYNPSLYSDSNKGNFEALWSGINNSYAFWGIDPTDWDKVYNEYQPKINENLTKDQLFEIFKSMTATLLDGHFSLTRDSIYYSPRSNTLLDQGNSELYFLNDSLALSNYLESVEILPDETGYYGRVKNENLQYFRLSKFFYSSCFVLDYQKAQKSRDFILNAPAWSKGLILDLRSNGGGDATDMLSFIKMFTPTDVNWGKRRGRIGQGRFDYGPWSPFVISATPSAYTKPIVVLVDRFSVSMAEITTMALATLPNVTVIGQQTFGAQGPLAGSPSDIFLGGEFKLPNGWVVKVADWATTYNDGKCYEGIGFPPDVNVKFDWNAYEATQTDNQLEAAINKLR